MWKRKIEEMEKEICDLWIPDCMTIEEAYRKLAGYKLHRVYCYSKYREVELQVWKKDSERLYAVFYVPTGVYKCITPQWKEAERVARLLGRRCNMLSNLLG